jgi:hypothetical protein
MTCALVENSIVFGGPTKNRNRYLSRSAEYREPLAFPDVLADWV